MLPSRLLAFFGRNLPSRKPQLWANLPLALERKLAIALGSRLSPGWMERPRVVRLSGRRLLMEVVPRDQIGRAIYLYGVFEVAVTHFIRAALAPGNVFVDVGANSGYYTLIAADRVGPTGEVHAFEPVDATRARLLRNVVMNDLHNCVVRGEAVWSSAGEVSFYETNVPDNSGISSVLPGPGRHAEGRRVPSTTVDAISRGLARPIDLMKIDVEGAEMAVLEGGRDVLGSAHAPALVFESYDISRVAPFLAELGYEVRCLNFTARGGIDFPPLGTSFDNPFAAYEAPNYVALKPGQKNGTFAEIRRAAEDAATAD